MIDRDESQMTAEVASENPIQLPCSLDRMLAEHGWVQKVCIALGNFLISATKSLASNYERNCNFLEAHVGSAGVGV